MLKHANVKVNYIRTHKTQLSHEEQGSRRKSQRGYHEKDHSSVNDTQFYAASVNTSPVVSKRRMRRSNSMTTRSNTFRSKEAKKKNKEPKTPKPVVINGAKITSKISPIRNSSKSQVQSKSEVSINISAKNNYGQSLQVGDYETVSFKNALNTYEQVSPTTRSPISPRSPLRTSSISLHSVRSVRSVYSIPSIEKDHLNASYDGIIDAKPRNINNLSNCCCRSLSKTSFLQTSLPPSLYETDPVYEYEYPSDTLIYEKVSVTNLGMLRFDDTPEVSELGFMEHSMSRISLPAMKGVASIFSSGRKKIYKFLNLTQYLSNNLPKNLQNLPHQQPESIPPTTTSNSQYTDSAIISNFNSLTATTSRITDQTDNLSENDHENDYYQGTIRSKSTTQSEAYSILSERLPNMVVKETVKSKTKLKKLKENNKNLLQKETQNGAQATSSPSNARSIQQTQGNDESYIAPIAMEARDTPHQVRKPKQTSNKSKSVKYTFIAYQPDHFLEIRKSCKINEEKFITSLSHLVTLTNPGSSKSAFWQTSDKDFFIKTIDRIEVDNFLKMFDDYRKRVTSGSLLSQMLGVYRLKYESFDLRLVVLTNIAPTTGITLNIDIKGATNDTRKAKVSESCLKDLDLREKYPEGFKINEMTFKKIKTQLEKDTLLLSKYNIMDYSLLLCFEPLDALDNESENLQNATPNTIKTNNTSIFSAICQDLSHDNKRFIIYMGIIDLLQKYGFKKNTEHRIRSLYEDGKKISIVKPEFYRKRFLEFVEGIFKVEIPDLKESGHDKAESSFENTA